MSTLFIDRKGISCALENGALVMSEKGERIGVVPTAPLERIIFKTDAAIRTSDLARLGDKGVGIIFLSGRGAKPVLFLPAQHHDARRRLSQYLLSESEEFCRCFSVQLIREKIEGQKRHLEDRMKGRAEVDAALSVVLTWMEGILLRLDGALTLDALRGLEGSAARHYFKGLSVLADPALGFTGRNRCPPRDPLNAILSLTYTLLAADAALSAHRAGLDPYVGLLHKVEFGRCSLACDLIEPFRAEADRFALQLFDSGILTPGDFSISASGCLLKKDGRVKFYPRYEEAAHVWRDRLDKRCLSLASDWVVACRTGRTDENSSSSPSCEFREE